MPRKQQTNPLIGRFCLKENRERALPGGRTHTSVTLERGREAYHWMTDRGRSRVVKH